MAFVALYLECGHSTTRHETYNRGEAFCSECGQDRRIRYGIV